MLNVIPTKRPVSLTIICFLCLAAIVLTIVLYIRIYNRNPYAGALEHKWYIILIALQLPILAGVLLMFFLKRLGFWVFLVAKVLFFVLPAAAGADVMGLMAPIFMIESATFFVLFGKRIKYMH